MSRRTLVRQEAAARVAKLIGRAQAGDRSSLEELIVSHRPFVARLARVSFNGAVPLDDLVQEGLIGLLDGIRRYDPGHPRGATLLGYARPWIERAIKRANQRADLRYGGAPLPEELYWAAGRMARAERRLGPGAAPGDVADEARVGRRQAPALAVVRSRTLSRIGPAGAAGESPGTVDPDRIPDAGTPSALAGLLHEEQLRLARTALAALPLRWRRLLVTGLGRRVGPRVASREHQRALDALRAAYAVAERGGRPRID